MAIGSRKQTNDLAAYDRDRYVRMIEASKLPALLRMDRVAKMLDLDKRRIYEMIETGELTAVRHGTRGHRIFRESLMDWLRRGGSGQ